MYLYHFTDKNINVLKVEYFGSNSYTKNDKKYTIPRLFFYNSLTPKEYYVKNCQYRYTVQIDKKNIYNLDKDILNLKKQFNYDIDNILYYIAKHYLGCCYTTSFLCFCIFKDIVPIDKVTLWE